jgi:hypothetical protein
MKSAATSLLCFPLKAYALLRVFELGSFVPEVDAVILNRLYLFLCMCVLIIVPRHSMFNKPFGT